MAGNKLGISPAVDVYVDEAGRYRFMNANGGTAYVIEADERFGDLVARLDGSLTLEQLTAEMRRGAEMDAQEVTTTIGRLRDAGLVQELCQVPAELERYDRQINLLADLVQASDSTFELQNRLTSSHVAVVGLGATGSAVATTLAAMGVGEITLIDGDVVAWSNLSRQLLYVEADVDQPKVSAAGARLLAMNSTVRVHEITRRVRNGDDARDVLGAPSIVANCADDPSVFVVNSWLSPVCQELGVPLLTGAGYRGHHGWLGPTLLPDQAPRWRCYALANPDPRETGEWTNVRPGGRPEAGSIAPFACVTANIQAWECVRILLGLAPLFLARYAQLNFDTLEMEWRTLASACSDCVPGAHDA